MASLGIAVGPLSSVRQYGDAVAADVLLKFYASRADINDGATEQEKLSAIVGWLEAYIVAGAREYEYEQRRAALRDEVNGEIGLG